MLRISRQLMNEERGGLTDCSKLCPTNYVSPWSWSDVFAIMTGDQSRNLSETGPKDPQITATTEYCAKLQQWMWQYYWGSASLQGCLALPAFPFPAPCAGSHAPGAADATSGIGQQVLDARNWYSYPHPYSVPSFAPHPGGAHAEQVASDARPALQQPGNTPQAGTALVWGRCFSSEVV